MTCGQKWDWLLKALTAGGTVGAVVFALFQDSYRRFLWHPVLKLAANIGPPDCIKISSDVTDKATGLIIGSADTYYLRIRVENVGNEAARNVEVYARSLRTYRNGAWTEVRQFPPMNLTWSNLGTLYLAILAPNETFRLCDVAHIVEPGKRSVFRGAEDAPEQLIGLEPNRVLLSFDLIQRPNHRGHIVGPGIYQLEIEVGAENAKPVRTTLEIFVHGDWDENEGEMLGRLVKICGGPNCSLDWPERQ